MSSVITFKPALLAGVASVAMSAGAAAQTVCTPAFEDVLFGLDCTGDQGATPITFNIGDFVILDENWTSTATAVFDGIPYQIMINGSIDTSASLARAVIITGGAGGSTVGFLNTGSLVSGTGTTIEVSGDYTLGSFVNSGNITGAGTAVLLNAVTGNVSNNGSIRGGTSGLQLLGPVGGSIHNFGDLTAGAFGLVVLGDVEGDLLNFGTIASDTSFFGVGIQLSGDIAGHFYNSGTISSRYIGILYDSETIGGVFENAGDIVADLAIVGFNPDSSMGRFRNTGTITGYLGGVQLGRVLGSVENTGTITAGYGTFYIQGLVSGDFVNSGFIGGTSELDNQWALQFFTGLEGDFENTGRMSGDYAVFINALGGQFYNSADGEIVGVTSALNIGTFTGASFQNDGLIQADGFALSLQNATEGVSVFNNFGTILGEQDFGFALLSANPPGTQTAFVQNWGLIQGGDFGLVTDGHDHVDVLNWGVIRSSSPDGVALSSSAPSLQVFNFDTGLIEGDLGVQTFGGNDRVFNSGIIRGSSGIAVDLGDGDDLFVNQWSGLFEGDLIGGDGHDAVILSGTHFLDMLIDGFEFVSFNGIGTGTGAGQTYIALRRDLSALEEGYNSGWLDIADHTFTAQNFYNIGTLVSRGGTVDAFLFNAGELLGTGLTVTGDVINLALIDPAGTGIGSFTFQGDFFNLADGEEYDFPTVLTGMVASAEPLTPSSITAYQDGTLIFDVSGTAHDQLIIGGTASINGTVALRGDWSELARSRQTVSLVTAAGGISGSPDLLAATGLLFTPQLSLGANSLDLTFQAADFATALAPSTYNQTQAALGLQARWSAGASPIDDLILDLNAGLASGPVLQGLSAEELPAVMRAGARQGTSMAQTVSDCALGRRGSACDASGDDQGVTLWTSYTTGSATLAADSNAAGVEESFGVVTQGIQYAISDDLAVGGFIAAGRGQARVGDAAGNGTVDSLGAGLFGSARFGGLGLALTAGYADLDVETGRGTPGGLVEGDTGGSVAFARLDARLQREAGPARYGIDLSGRYAYSEIDAHSQSGASLYALDVHSDGFRSVTWAADAFVEYTAAPTTSGHQFVFGASGGFLTGAGEDSASGVLEIPGAGQAYEVLGPVSGADDLGMHAGGFIGLESRGGDLSVRVTLDGYKIGEESSTQASARIAWRF